MSAFYTSKSVGDLIDASEWNAFVDYTEATSGAAYHSGLVTMKSGVTSDDNIYHKGAATNLFLSGVIQTVLKSGAEYWKGYLSGQLALYSETYSQESDLTSVLDDNYAGSANVNWTKITAISSGFDGRLDTLEGAGYLVDVVEDTTPELGGDLDLNSFGVSGLGHGLQLHPSGLILSSFTGSGGSWQAASSPILGLMFISGS